VTKEDYKEYHSRLDIIKLKALGTHKLTRDDVELLNEIGIHRKEIDNATANEDGVEQELLDLWRDLRSPAGKCPSARKPR